MKRNYDVILVREIESGHEFIFIDTSKGTIPTRNGKETFNEVVGFPAKDFRGESSVSYPVVYSDYTVGINNQQAQHVSFTGIPRSIRRRFERWLT